MKKYTIAFIIIVMMSIVFQPRPAQAAITIDFAAIAGTIQEVVQSIKDKVSKLKITVSQWKITKSLGAAITSISEYYHSVKLSVAEKLDRYRRYKEDVRAFIRHCEDFYYAGLDIVQTGLDMANSISEIGERFKAYWEEVQNIGKYVDDTKKICVDNFKEVKDVHKNLKDSYDEIAKNYGEEKKALEELQAQLNEIDETFPSYETLTQQVNVKAASVEAIFSTMYSYEAQLNNAIYSVKGLYYDCIRNILMTKARIERIICNIAGLGEAHNFVSQVNQMQSSINNWSNSVNNLSSDIGTFEKDLAGCEKYDDYCRNGYPVRDSLGVIVMEDGKVVIDKEETQKACDAHRELCKGQTPQVIEPTPLQGGLPRCEEVMHDIFTGWINNDSSGSSSDSDSESSSGSQTQSFNYSIFNSSKIANAKIDLTDESIVKGGTNDDGTFLLPSTLALCCDMQTDDIQEDGKLKDCLQKFNYVLFSATGTPIDSKYKEFFQCLRQEIGKSEFEDVVNANDTKTAGKILNESYAEYLAGMHLEALQSYNDSFYYKKNQIDPVATTKTKDIQSAWASIIDMNLKINNRINEINKIKAKEQLIKAFSNAISYNIQPMDTEKEDTKE